MSASYDVAAIGNAIVDVIAPADEAFLVDNALAKGAMTLIDEARASELYARMAAGIETSGGSAGNTVAGVASLGGRAAYVGKVAKDQLGEVFIHDTRSIGVHFQTPQLNAGAATGRCLINVTPDGERTMCTFLGASTELTAADVDAGGDRRRGDRLPGGLPVRSARGAARLRQGGGPGAGVGPHASRSPSRTPSWSSATAPRCCEFIEAEVDLVFANEAEITSLFETADFDAADPRDPRHRPGSPPSPAARRARWWSPPTHTPRRRGLPGRQAGRHHRRRRPVRRRLHAGAGPRASRSTDCARLGGLAAAEVISHYGPRPQVSLAELAAAHGLA